MTLICTGIPLSRELTQLLKEGKNMPNQNKFLSWVRLLITIILFVLFSTQALAGSFDCNKTSSWLEKSVCSDEVLSKLDEQMAKAYHDALASLSPEGQKETKEYQRQWLEEISYIKPEHDKFYAERKEYSATDHDEYIVRDLRDSYKERIEQLQQILTKFRGRIFRDVYVSYSETNKTCEYLLVKRTLIYPQIENPRDENEKSWNALVFRKAHDGFKKHLHGNDCTNISDKYWVSFSNKHLISFQGDQYYYAHGAAHGYGSHIISFSWLWKEKRELQAADLFDDKTGWRSKLAALVAQMQKEWEATAYNNMTLITPDMDKLFSANKWMISKDELGFWLYTHNFADAILVTIDWKTLNPYLSKKGRSLIYD